jgi:hypothetical protein
MVVQTNSAMELVKVYINFDSVPSVPTEKLSVWGFMGKKYAASTKGTSSNCLYLFQIMNRYQYLILW